jgi:hypothetical protein
MVKEMKFRNNTVTKAKDKTAPKRKSSRLYIDTLEYGMIANLVVQQYQQEGEVKFDALLSIPLTDRIPGLIEKFGKKTMHRLLVMILSLQPWVFLQMVPLLPTIQTLTITHSRLMA